MQTIFKILYQRHNLPFNIQFQSRDYNLDNSVIAEEFLYVFIIYSNFVWKSNFKTSATESSLTKLNIKFPSIFHRKLISSN